METRLTTIHSSQQLFVEEDRKALAEAAQIISNGGLVAFPTETVYGLGGNGLDSEAARKIYAAKGRPSDNPLILHVDNIGMLSRVVAEVSEMAQQIIAAFCPGPITMILPKAPVVPLSVTGGLSTVAVRIPENDVARELIRLADTPIAGPSANISGKPSPTTAKAVYHDLQGRIEMILDAGACKFGVESTIVDCTGTIPVILRPGAITREMLLEIFPQVDVDMALVGADVVPKAPGMKYKHYAPVADMEIIEATDQRELSGIFSRELEIHTALGLSVGIIASEETVAAFPQYPSISYGKRGDLSAMAENLYECLRYFDDKAIDFIIAEGTHDIGLGAAVMNRLRKAAGFKIINK